MFNFFFYEYGILRYFQPFPKYLSCLDNKFSDLFIITWLDTPGLTGKDSVFLDIIINVCPRNIQGVHYLIEPSPKPYEADVTTGCFTDEKPETQIKEVK